MPWKLNRNGQDMLRDAEARVVTAPPRGSPPTIPRHEAVPVAGRPPAPSQVLDQERESPFDRQGLELRCYYRSAGAPVSSEQAAGEAIGEWSVMQGKAAATCDLLGLTCNQTQKYLERKKRENTSNQQSTKTTQSTP